MSRPTTTFRRLLHDEMFDITGAVFVVVHAYYKKTRGKNPSLPYDGVRNPKEALANAQLDVLFSLSELVGMNLYYLKQIDLNNGLHLRILFDRSFCEYHGLEFGDEAINTSEYLLSYIEKMEEKKPR